MRAAVALFLLAFAGAAFAQSDEDRYNIMRPEPGSREAAKPEPWLAPKYKSPRGTVKHAVVPRPQYLPERRTHLPPPMVVPQTGAVLPNLPQAGGGAGPGGRETFQDRAARCAHQAGVYGPAAGERNAYIGGCINQ